MLFFFIYIILINYYYYMQTLFSSVVQYYDSVTQINPGRPEWLGSFHWCWILVAGHCEGRKCERGSIEPVLAMVEIGICKHCYSCSLRWLPGWCCRSLWKPKPREGSLKLALVMVEAGICRTCSIQLSLSLIHISEPTRPY